jgi:hypothetical protein
MLEEINSANEAIDTCGGTTAVADYFGVDVRVVSNWRTRGLPPETYAAFSELLASKGKTAPRSLWRQRAPAKGLA